MSKPTYQQQIEKESYLMIKEYGKEEALKTAKSYADGWINEIRNLPYYDSEKITRLEKHMWFWFSVGYQISNSQIN